MPNFLLQLTKSEQAQLLNELNYLNLEEIRGFFDTHGGESGTRRREEFSDFAATLSVAPDLIDMVPPRTAIESGSPFASPRAWERGLCAYAQYCDTAKVGYNVGKDDDAIGYEILSGAVGDAKAVAFLAIRRMRKHLPSVDEIVTSPDKTRVPEEKDRQIAAVGLLARVADRDLWCAWIYTARLLPEIAASCARVLMERAAPPGVSRWRVAGAEAQVKVLAQVRRST